MYQLALRFLGFGRWTKAFLLMSFDSLLAIFSLWLAFSLRLEEWYDPLGSAWPLFVVLPSISIPIFLKFGLYRAIIRYIGERVLKTIFQSVVLSFLIFSLVVFLSGSYFGVVPRTVPFLTGLLLLFFVVVSRFIARGWLANAYAALGGQVAVEFYVKNIIIYGAGRAGAQLASALSAGGEYCVIAFIDDDKRVHKQKLDGIKIYAIAALNQLIEENDISDVLLAMPAIPRGRRSEIVRLLEPYPVHVRTMPCLVEMAQGKVRFDDLQEVDIADLLGRDAVSPDQNLLSANIEGKVVLVTGAGGSIGSELCRQIIFLQPAKLILYELNEFALYEVDKSLRQLVVNIPGEATFEIIPFLGSVVDGARFKRVCKTFLVQTVYHSAAFKHVPLVEYNTSVAVRNNVQGTLNIALAAMAAKVETFVLISTDKAVRPTNTMGATKRLAELILQALSLRDTHNTRFTMVRFGNVLGSSGSVIPLFREQIARGGPVTVTDERMLRYFMTIPEAAQLVIQAGAMGSGGDVFVLDMGEPIKINELAKRMIRLSGLEVKDQYHVDGDIDITYTGLRPGEKLYEELLIGDNVSETEHCRILRAEESVTLWADLEKNLDDLRIASEENDCHALRRILMEVVTGYVPQCEVSDWLCRLNATEN